ncbi:MAG: Photosynthetic apparatus regulatory protein RegA [Verrucomicrobiota bacterium]|jgi:DNA-binding response OmpR family regulator
MKKHILIVDDEAEIRDLLAQYLGSAGFRTTTAATPAEAFAAIERDAPHLVISDLQLEESDGLAMLEKIRVRLPRVPLILLTGVLFDQQVVANTLSQKVDCYIEKTAPLSRVLAEIKRLTRTGQ